MTPEEIARLDQATAELADSQPKMLKRYYDNCLEQGFTKEQAFVIVLQIVRSMFSFNKPPEPLGDN